MYKVNCFFLTRICPCSVTASGRMGLSFRTDSAWLTDTESLSKTISLHTSDSSKKCLMDMRRLESLEGREGKAGQHQPWKNISPRERMEKPAAVWTTPGKGIGKVPG